MAAPAGANVTVARGKGVSFAARKSGPIGSPAVPVAGVIDEVRSRASVAAASSVIVPPLNLTEPVGLIVALAKGTLSSVDAAKAKWWSAEVQNTVLDACVQLYGGYGYMREYRVARAWMDGRVTKIWAGSNEIMKELIGRDLGL